MRRLHESRGSRTTIFLTPVADPARLRPRRAATATAASPASARSRTAEEPITTNTINAGIYLIDAALLDRIPAGRVVSIEREFFPALIADGIPCYGWSGAAYWRDIGSPAAYRDAQVDLLSGRVRSPLSPPGEARDGSWIAAERPRGPRRPRAGPLASSASGVEVGAGAHVGPLTVIGDRSRIAAGARVEGADPLGARRRRRAAPPSDDC